MKPNKEAIRKWVAALRSGEYKQGRDILRSGDSYCCLGVACNISGLGKWTEVIGGFAYECHNGGEVDKLSLPITVQNWLGVEYSIPMLKLGEKRWAGAARLNDVDFYGFAEIADAIERTYLQDDA